MTKIRQERFGESWAHELSTDLRRDCQTHRPFALGSDAQRRRSSRKAAELAARYGVASVCIKPYAVALAARILKGSGVEVGTTVGFPHGGHATAVKVFEAEQAMADGATELDMVINIGQAMGGEWDAVSVRHRRRDQSGS